MKLVQHSAIYFAGRILPALIGLFAVSVYTRVLDPASIGTYAMIASVAAFASVGFIWLRVAVLRTLGSVASVEPAFIQTVVALFALTALVVAALESAGLLIYQRSISPELIALAVGATVSIAWFDLNVTLLQARRDVTAFGVSNLTRAVATLAFSLGMVVLGEKSRALFGGFILGNAAAALVGVRSWLPAIRPRFDLRLSTELFRFGWPITIKGSLDQLTVMFDRLFLGLLAGASAVGVYAVAFDFSRQTVFLLIGSTALAGQPLANRLLDLSGVDAARVQLRQNIELMLGVALPAVAGLIVLTEPIANTVLGPSFRGDARFVIGMIAFSTALAGLRTFYFDQAFELARHTRPQALISGIVALVGVTCSIALIPRLGALGAAYSSVASGVFGILLSFLWGRRVFPMPIPAAAYVQSGIATLGMVAVLTLLPWPRGLAGLALLATVGALVYGGLYLAATASSRALGRAFARGSTDAG